MLKHASNSIHNTKIFGESHQYNISNGIGTDPYDNMDIVPSSFSKEIRNEIREENGKAQNAMPSIQRYNL